MKNFFLKRVLVKCRQYSAVSLFSVAMCVGGAGECRDYCEDFLTIPSGSYQISCVNPILVNVDPSYGEGACYLQAKCRKGTTQPYNVVSRISLPCAGDIANINGNLACKS